MPLDAAADTPSWTPFVVFIPEGVIRSGTQAVTLLRAVMDASRSLGVASKAGCPRRYPALCSIF